MHAAFNSVSGFLNGLFADVQPAAHIPFELVLAMCGLLTVLVLIIVTKDVSHTVGIKLDPTHRKHSLACKQSY